MFKEGIVAVVRQDSLVCFSIPSLRLSAGRDRTGVFQRRQTNRSSRRHQHFTDCQDSPYLTRPGRKAPSRDSDGRVSRGGEETLRPV